MWSHDFFSYKKVFWAVRYFFSWLICRGNPRICNTRHAFWWFCLIPQIYTAFFEKMATFLIILAIWSPIRRCHIMKGPIMRSSNGYKYRKRTKFLWNVFVYKNTVYVGGRFFQFGWFTWRRLCCCGRQRNSRFWDVYVGGLHCNYKSKLHFCCS